MPSRIRLPPIKPVLTFQPRTSDTSHVRKKKKRKRHLPGLDRKFCAIADSKRKVPHQPPGRSGTKKIYTTKKCNQIVNLPGEENCTATSATKTTATHPQFGSSDACKHECTHTRTPNTGWYACQQELKRLKSRNGILQPDITHASVTPILGTPHRTALLRIALHLGMVLNRVTRCHAILVLYR